MDLLVASPAILEPVYINKLIANSFAITSKDKQLYYFPFMSIIVSVCNVAITLPVERGNDFVNTFF